MKLAEFKNSKWYQEASQPGAQNIIGKNLAGWLGRVSNLGLATKAKELWGYITSSNATGADKVLVLAALAYLISPLDLVPDAIPVVGWLDDIGLATFVLQFLNRKISRMESRSATDDEETVIDLENIPQPITNESADAKADHALLDRLDQIRRNAMNLEAEELIQSTNDLETEAQAPLAQILFAGRYNTGKSTLLNTLLGCDWLPTGPVPTTKGIIYIMNGARPTLVSQDQDGVTTIHSNSDDLLDKTNPVINKARSIVLTIPSPLLGAGVALVDSPGLEDPQLEFSRLTLELAPSAAMVVLLLDATTTMSRPETEFLEGLLASDRNRKLLIVVNKTDRLTPAELEVVTGAIRKQLQELNCNAPLFMLSAEKAKHEPSTVDDASGSQEFLRGCLKNTNRIILICTNMVRYLRNSAWPVIQAA